MSVTDTAFSGSISATTVVIGPTVRVTYDPTHYTNFTASVNGSLNITTTGTQVSTSAMLNVTNGTQSTATNNGAIVATGGIGLGGNINAFGSATIGALVLSNSVYKSMPLPLQNTLIDAYAPLGPFNAINSNAVVLTYKDTLGLWLYEFVKNSTRSVGINFMIPHDYVQGTPMYVKLTLALSSGGQYGNIAWNLKGKLLTEGPYDPFEDINVSGSRIGTWGAGYSCHVYITIPASGLTANRTIAASLTRVIAGDTIYDSIFLFSASLIYACTTLGRTAV